MSLDLKRQVISAGLRGIAATGADRWLAPVAQGAGIILTFHHVRPIRSQPFQPNALLEITPEHLDSTLTIVREQGFEIIPLDDVPARLAAPRGGPFAVLTFDDGYRDNRDHALLVLNRHEAPWTLFVAADYASGEGRLWWIELEEVIRRRDRIVLDDGRLDLPARSAEEKTQAFASVYAALRAGPEDVLRSTLARWCEEEGIEPASLVRSLCLGWDELRALRAAAKVTFGAHTLSHPMLAKHEEGRAWLELEGSRAVIEQKLGCEVRHLAYPVGDPTSAGAREFRLAREARYATAVTTRPGHLFAAHAQHLTALPRVSVNGLHQTADAVRALLSGVPFLLWNRGRRLNVA